MRARIDKFHIDNKNEVKITIICFCGFTTFYQIPYFPLIYTDIFEARNVAVFVLSDLTATQLLAPYNIHAVYRTLQGPRGFFLTLRNVMSFSVYEFLEFTSIVFPHWLDTKFCIFFRWFHSFGAFVTFSTRYQIEKNFVAKRKLTDIRMYFRESSFLFFYFIFFFH